MGDTEVTNFYILLICNKYVGRLDITMNDTLAMGIVERLGTFKDDLND